MSSHPIPLAALDDRLGFVGTAGSGKTYNAGAGVERLLAAGGRVIIPDPLGVWWGLGLNSDGRSPAPWREKGRLVIFGGEHGDLPLNEHAGALIGETVAKMAESAILDLSGFGTKAAEIRFMLAFLTALYRHASREPVHLVFDEADMWAPQQERDKGESPKLLGMMETVVRRGRIRGFIPWLISQRPAVLNKNVLSQVDGLVAFKLTSSQDRAALGAWIEGQADREQGKAILGSLPTLPIGTGVVWLPNRNVLATSAFPPKLTFDSSRTPKRGERVERKELKPLDLDKLKSKLASIEEEAKANDPRALKAEVARLTRELAAAAKQAPATAPSWPDQRNLVQQLTDELSETSAALERLTASASELQRRQKLAAAALGGESVSIPTVVPPQRRPAAVPPSVERRPVPAREPGPSEGNGKLPPGERAVLIAAVQYGGVDRDQLSVLTGYKRSSRDAYIARLRDKGLVEVAGQTVNPSSAAADALGTDYEPLPTGDELQKYWVQRLPPGEVAILNALIESYPNPVARNELDDRTGYKRSSRDAYIQRLKARRLVHVDGADVTASETLFQ